MCTCQECGELYKVDLLIPDELWERIRKGKNMLCGACIMVLIEGLDNYGAYKLT